jgi:hypothetical protein
MIRRMFFTATVFFLLMLSNISFSNECFKIGESWHDLKLPDGAKNMRWLFGDNEKHFPFMSVTFDLEDEQFDIWAKKCGVALDKIGKRKFWDKDLETGGFLSVVKYESQRYCVGIIRTPIPEEKRYVDNKEYYGCPLDELINY